MDTPTQDPSEPPGRPRPDTHLVACLAAIGRVLEGQFTPRVFLDDLSAALGAIVPQDRLGILYLADHRSIFSVFAEHVAPGLLPWANASVGQASRPSDHRAIRARGTSNRTPRRRDPLGPRQCDGNAIARNWWWGK